MNDARPHPSWSAVETWRAPRRVVSWSHVTDWAAIQAQIAERERAALIRLREWWDARLAPLGGCPSADDWSDFALLRRDREEDWSAWLGQLLADSQSGTLAALLFHAIGLETQSAVRPTVHRELPVGDRRADLVVAWSDQVYSHVEVKVGDPHLEKTPDTVRKVRARFPDVRRGTDFLLVLPEQVRAWEDSTARVDPDYGGIHVITWADVSAALRRALLTCGEGESLRWRVWAHAFCGAIEQDLLEIRGGGPPDAWARALPVSGVRAARDVLEAGRKGEANDE